ncbi:Amino acid permease 2 [Rhynchospora pubera]|uniref:Amino acid permease 2 n=1 Tax=Rhynchospora pubera TaxID=906938 RepID=A0AAV8ALU1_9POAL|nr:Amino acid permease 2 [Rhynchospora pubera]
MQTLLCCTAAIGYTIAASVSMVAIKRSNCFHEHGKQDPCLVSSNIYIIMFGVINIFFSQIPDLDQISWLSIVAAIMSFTYSTIGLGLGIVQVVAFGDITFAYSYSLILIEIQHTIKAPPPSETKVMKRATIISVAVTTIFYMLCGCMGYAAFGDAAPGNLLIGFRFYNPFWLLDIANGITIHLVGAYH